MHILNINEAIKKVNNFRYFSVIVKITLGKGFLMKVHDIDYWRYGGQNSGYVTRDKEDKNVK